MRGTIPCYLLKEIATIFSPLVDEIKLNCTAEGIEIRCVDPAHVAIAGIRVSKDQLRDYTLIEDKEEVAIDLKKLSAYLRLIPPADGIEVRTEDGRLVMSSNNITRRMSLIDTSEMTDTRIPNLDMDSFIKAEAAVFHDAIRGMKSIESDAITMCLTDGKFCMASSNDIDDVDYQIENGNGVTIEGRAVAIFPTDYLVTMFTSMDKSFTVTVRLTDDYPARIEFEGEGIEGFYLVAPRIESEGTE